jgi:hypothetical protein
MWFDFKRICVLGLDSVFEASCGIYGCPGKMRGFLDFPFDSLRSLRVRSE